MDTETQQQNGGGETPKSALDLMRENAIKFSRRIVEFDRLAEQRPLTDNERMNQQMLIGWERGISWSYAVVEAEKIGKLQDLLSILTSH